MAEKRSTIIAGNWKMYKTTEEALEFVENLTKEVADTPHQVFLAVPFTLIRPLVDRCQNTNITIGAQNMNDASEGAFTGEIAGKMLVDVGAKFVILGHSERRHIFGETDEFINRKIKAALSEGLQPILCVGETQKERKEEKAEQVLKTQLEGSLSDLSAEQIQQMIIAYEPVWAIGTGLTATPDDAQEMHQHCRQFLSKKYKKGVADLVSILYGGSVKPDNVKALMEQADIDGVLVGGASLSSKSFCQIVNYQTTKD